MKRALDFALALMLLVLFSPLLVAFACRKIVRRQCLGQHRKPFFEYYWEDCKIFAKLPLLWNILRGDISFVGPSITGTDGCIGDERRYQVKPGIICLWWLRCRTNVAYGTELEMDLEYIANRSFGSDLRLLLLAIPVFLLYHANCRQMKDKVEILGVMVDNLTLDQALQRLICWLNDDCQRYVCFVNVHYLNIASKDPAYRRVLCDSHLILGDGSGLKLAGQLLDNHIRQNVNGTDLFPRLCRELCERKRRIFLLGGVEQAVTGVCRWLESNYPGIVVVGYHHGYFSDEQQEDIVARIAAAQVDLLLVGLGAPRQELWIAEHLEKTKVKLAMGVGGLFDVYSQRISRGPRWMRDIGMEWLYRLYQEPGRLWTRYLIGNVVFIVRVLRQRWTRK